MQKRVSVIPEVGIGLLVLFYMLVRWEQIILYDSKQRLEGLGGEW